MLNIWATIPSQQYGNTSGYHTVCGIVISSELNKKEFRHKKPHYGIKRRLIEPE